MQLHRFIKIHFLDSKILGYLHLMTLCYMDVMKIIILYFIASFGICKLDEWSSCFIKKRIRKNCNFQLLARIVSALKYWSLCLLTRVINQYSRFGDVRNVVWLSITLKRWLIWGNKNNEIDKKLNINFDNSMIILRILITYCSPAKQNHTNWYRLV